MASWHDRELRGDEIGLNKATNISKIYNQPEPLFIPCPSPVHHWSAKTDPPDQLRPSSITTLHVSIAPQKDNVSTLMPISYENHDKDNIYLVQAQKVKIKAWA
jgi:hypothetical protein